mmetsp:Transcript_30198/g.69704  ORF Transcript_30198/g.69704 Transcript_30198/m.69704 type:complete len:205 (-) Transcript_30198:791-1405(-)
MSAAWASPCLPPKLRYVRFSVAHARPPRLAALRSGLRPPRQEATFGRLTLRQHSDEAFREEHHGSSMSFLRLRMQFRAKALPRRTGAILASCSSSRIPCRRSFVCTGLSNRSRGTRSSVYKQVLRWRLERLATLPGTVGVSVLPLGRGYTTMLQSARLKCATCRRCKRKRGDYKNSRKPRSSLLSRSLSEDAKVRQGLFKIQRA